MNHPARCADVQELVWLAIDDELPAAERATLDAHLATCADCRRKVESARRVAAGLKRLPEAAAPAGFKAATLARLEGGAVIRGGWGWKTLAAAAAVVLLASYFVIRSGRDDATIGGESAREQLASAPKNELSRADAPAAGEPPAAAPMELKDFEERRKELQSADEAPPAPVLQAAADAEAPKPGGAGVEKQAESDAKENAAADGRALDAANSGDAVDAVEASVRAASSPQEALRGLVGRVEQQVAVWRQEQGEAKSKKARDGGAFGEGAENKKAPTVPSRPQAEKLQDRADRDESRELGDDATSAAVDFLVVPANAEVVRQWLAARGGVAKEADVAVVDVAPEELAALRAALVAAKHPAEPLTADDWVERVAAAAQGEARTRGELSGPRTPGAPATAGGRGANGKVGGSRGAPAKGDGDKGEVAKAEAAKDAASKRAAPLESGLVKSAEPPRVRVVLWLAPPTPAPTGRQH